VDTPQSVTLPPVQSSVALVVAARWPEDLPSALVAQEPPECVVLSPLQLSFAQFDVLGSFPLRCTFSFLPSWSSRSRGGGLPCIQTVILCSMHSNCKKS